MSSETSTNKVRLKPDSTGESGSVRPQADRGGLEPWQFFVLAALGCATAVTFMSREQGPTAVILLGVLMATAALVGNAALRMLRPLVSLEEDRTVMVGQRTRVALEREKLMTLRSIKELEFDRAMGRLSDEDWNEMSGRLRARAARLIRQLDAGAGYRGQIERDLAKRIEGPPNARPKGSRSERSTTPDENVQHLQLDGHSATLREAQGRPEPDRGPIASAARDGDAEADGRSATAVVERTSDHVCAACATANDHDARFCKGCGRRLE
jgi:hypothetical protein